MTFFKLISFSSVILGFVVLLRVVCASNKLLEINGTDFNVLDFQAYILKPRNYKYLKQESQTKPPPPISTNGTLTDFQPKLQPDYFDNVVQRPRNATLMKTPPKQLNYNRVFRGRNIASPPEHSNHQQRLLINHVLYHTGTHESERNKVVDREIPIIPSQSQEHGQDQDTEIVNRSGILLYPSPSPKDDSVLEQPPADNSRRGHSQNEQYFQ